MMLDADSGTARFNPQTLSLSMCSYKFNSSPAESPTWLRSTVVTSSLQFMMRDFLTAGGTEDENEGEDRGEGEGEGKAKAREGRVKVRAVTKSA